MVVSLSDSDLLRNWCTDASDVYQISLHLNAHDRNVNTLYLVCTELLFFDLVLDLVFGLVNYFYSCTRSRDL